MLHISYFVSSDWKQGHADRECLILQNFTQLNVYLFSNMKFQTFDFSQLFLGI